MPDEPIGNPPTQTVDLSETEAATIAAEMNDLSFTDAYGSAWSQSSVLAAHSNTDANQRKRLLYLLYLYTQAVG